MKIKMELLSDTIFGNGESIPGGEDFSIQYDDYGFPYFKGSTFKGIYREIMEQYLQWLGKSEMDIKERINTLFGISANDYINFEHRLVFSDFKLSQYVRDQILAELGENKTQEILDGLSHIRTFTKIGEDGMVEEGSLRNGRCVNKGLVFYSSIECDQADEDLIKDSIVFVKWIGSMRNRGFGKVKISVID